MDSGPFRAQRPTERRAASSRERAAYRQPEEPEPAVEETKPVHRQTTNHQPHRPVREKSSKRLLLPVIGVLIAIALVATAWFWWSSTRSVATTGIDTGKYQAVFFTNGQVYFGKLERFGDEYLKLTKIYYLQAPTTDANTSENPQNAEADTKNDVQLIKLGEEIHGPEDSMVINRDQVLFYENLKTDSKVAKLIEEQSK